MPVIAAMIVGPADRRLALEQIDGLAEVRFCQTTDGLLELVASGRVDAVVADLHDAAGASVLPTLRALYRQASQLPFVLFCSPTPEAIRELPLSGALVRNLSLVFRNAEHLGVAMAPLLAPTRVPSAAETVARHAVPLVPPVFQPFILVCAYRANGRLRVSTAARWSGSPRRTLERALRLANLPSAGVLLGCCTALHAAWWLDVQGWSTKQVVGQMGFSHASVLYRVLRRHFGCTVRSLRDEVGFPDLLYRFEAMLLQGHLPSTPARSA